MPSQQISRREFVTATAALTAAATLPSGRAAAQPAATHRRMSISDAGFPQSVLESYKKAIRAMLALPPSDPRNWYRHAIVHALDCPHGNWWFLVWHRGYIGWFEQICRELSGDPDFALPYWDWTREPRVPAGMFDDVLTPTNPAYIPSLLDFQTQFETAVDNYWNSLSANQAGQLLIRGLRFPADLWFDIGFPGGPYFFDLANARGLTAAKPDLDIRTTRGVSLPTLLDALGPRDFIGFGSPKTFFHSGLTGFGVLEGQPHNRIHNCVGGIFTDANGNTTNVGGFMQSNLSPVDPLFFLHHANIDRIWDVWTRKQTLRGNPILPDGFPTTPGGAARPGSDYAAWAAEPFLFFNDAQGNPVTKTTAGDYATIGDFDYDYQPGSGEEVVPVVVAAAAAPAEQQFAVPLGSSAVNADTLAGGAVQLPVDLIERSTSPGGPRMVANVTVELPPLAHTQELAVVINPTNNAGAIAAASPHFVATLSMFGHHIIRGPVTFAVPLSEAISSLRASGLFGADTPLNLRVIGQEAPMGHIAAAVGGQMHQRAQVLSIEVQAL